MAQVPNNKNSKKNGVKYAVKSIAWLVEATFRAFVGVVMLGNFHNYFTTAAALFALATAGIIVVTHFVKAYK